MVLLHGIALHILKADADALAAHDDVQAQTSHLDHGRIARHIRLKVDRGYGLACDCCIVSRSEFRGYTLPLQAEPSGMAWSFREDDGVFRVTAKAVVAQFEPEKACQRQPLLLEIFDQFAFPFVE